MPHTAQEKARLKTLKRKRGIIQESIESLNRKLNNWNEAEIEINRDPFQLQQSMESTIKMFEKFDDIQDELEELSPAEITKRGPIQDAFDATIGRARKYLAGSGTDSVSVKSAQSSAPNENAAMHSSNFRLPTLLIPHFAGDISQWRTFYNLFKVTIHESVQLNAIVKLQYLLTYLKGEPLDIIKGLAITEGNYAVAWALLCKRYNCERRHIFYHFNSLCDLSELKHTANLSHFVSQIRKHTQALDALEYPLDQYDPMLAAVLLRKFSNYFRRRLDDYRGEETKYPSVNVILEFLDRECMAVDESVSGSASKNHKEIRPKVLVTQVSSESPRPLGKRPRNMHTNPPPSKRPRAAGSTEGVSVTRTRYQKCVCCNSDSHALFICQRFRGLGVPERRTIVKNAQICFKCLRSHVGKECGLIGKCRLCNNAEHNTLLCLGAVDSSKETPSASASKSVPPAIGLTTVRGKGRTPPSVLLGTALIKVQGGDGRFHLLNAIIDSASTTSFINMASAQRIGLRYKRNSEPVSGIGGCEAGVKGYTTCLIKPRHNDTPTLPTETKIIKKIVTLPYSPLPADALSHFSDLDLANPHYNSEQEVEFLIGADLYPLIYTGEKKFGPPGCPVALASIFGWVITGKVGHDSCDSYPQTALLSIAPSADALLRSFWELEEAPRRAAAHPDDIAAEKIFKEQHYRLPNGRYVVPLMIREDAPPLGETTHIALSCLRSIERRLEKNPILQQAYSDFMVTYERLDHMEPVLPESARYHIPHHFVLKSDGDPTKLRVVFHASQKSSTGAALNDIVYTGPKLQNDLFDVIARFRLHPKVFTCDISKMYRQILIRPEDRPYQHIFWRTDGKVQEFQLKTVTYGVSSAPYLALRVIDQLCSDEGAKYPTISRLVRLNRFVDDFAIGAKDVSTLLSLKEQVEEFLRLGCFEVGKYASNCREILEQVPPEHRLTSLDLNDENSFTKILGIHWNAQSDVFYYTAHKIAENAITKRNILSNVGRIFDPIGLLSPVVLKAKIIIQKLWIAGVDWDDKVPVDIETEWAQFCEKLPALNDVKIERCVTMPGADHFSLIGFCDASILGYNASIYLRSQSPEGVKVSLLAAKSKVAPTKTISVPRLELCGAQLLSALIAHVKEQVQEDTPIKHVATFTDSQVALAWIKTLPCKLKTFEANRVTQILEKTEPSNWHYVPSNENPSDVGSRGCFPDQLKDNALWWCGPTWLSLPIEKWPISSVRTKPGNAVALITINQSFWQPLITQYSNFNKLKRVTAWLLRYVQNLGKDPEKRTKTPLSVAELEQAMMCLIKAVQQNHFADELEMLEKSKQIPNRFRHLQPFIDSEGILRVGGRLRNASLPLHAKHPIILPKKDHFVTLLIDAYHLRYLHAGPRLLQSLLARRFWILSGRCIIRSRIGKCNTCFRVRPTTTQPEMGDLPVSRTNPPSKAFLWVGVDFGGPFLIREHKRRNPKLTKAYLCLFICQASRAVHLEAVSDLTTEAFLAAFDRFVNRRGVCRRVASDNATNLTGAKRYMKEVHDFLTSNKDQLHDQLASREVEWKTIPASSPHFAGSWESGIKSAKYHLKRIIGEQTLTFEEMATVFTKIEAILNSRPLCHLSSDAAEINVLTPGHFLVGGPLVAMPEYDFTETKTNRLSRWQMLQKITQHFWKVWSLDYLHTQIQRSKWQQRTENLKTGTVVIIAEDNTAPTHWKKGIIEDVHPGRDKVVRVVTVRTANSTLKRPAVKIYPLPNQ